MENLVDIPMEEYLNWDELGSHDVLKLARSSAHWKYGVDNFGVDSSRFGTAVHSAILEPEKYRENVVVIPECDKRTPKGKKIWEEFLEELVYQRKLDENIFDFKCGDQMKILVDNTLCVTKEEFDKIILIQARVDCNGILKDIIFAPGAKREYSGKGFIDIIPVKIRPDAILPSGTIVNVKTTKDARSFDRDCKNYLYDAQAAFHLTAATNITGTSMTNYIWLMIEKEPPHGIMLYRSNHSDLDWGFEYISKGLENWRRMKDTELNYYPDYPKEIVETGTIGPGFRWRQ